MEKEIKKTSGNTSAVFRKLTISATVLEYISFVVLLVIAGFFIYLGIDESRLMPNIDGGEIIVIAVVAIAILTLLASIGIAIAQSVLAKKLGNVGGVSYKATIAVLITLAGIALIATSFLGLLVSDLAKVSNRDEAKLFFIAGGIAAIPALTMLGSGIFNSILCKKTKTAK